MNLITENRVLVLGASSWLGFLLVNQLASKNEKVAGTIFKSNVIFSSNVEIHRIKNIEDYDLIFDSFQPTVIVNFLRGEDEEGFQLHQNIIQYSKNNSCHYVYASSVLALDGYHNIDLVESLEAKSISPYGIFKANAERELYDSTISWCILRFASVQGWVGHKKTRNQVFLEKLANGTEVLVDRGIVQNRVLASLLIDGIIELMNDKISGIIHFGAEDSSEEFHFLQNQALAFGFKTDLIIETLPKNVNLVAIPNKVYELYGDKYKVTEKDTIEGLLQIKELVQIKNL